MPAGQSGGNGDSSVEGPEMSVSIKLTETLTENLRGREGLVLPSEAWFLSPVSSGAPTIAELYSYYQKYLVFRQNWNSLSQEQTTHETYSISLSVSLRSTAPSHPCLQNGFY